MFSKLLILVTAVCALSTCIFGDARKVAAYYANWNSDMKKIEMTIGNLDEVLYAFAAVNPVDGSIYFTCPENDFKYYASKQLSVQDALRIFKESPNGNFADMASLKDQYPKLKFVLCLGGWGKYSEAFSVGFNTEAKRERFISDSESILKGFLTPGGKPVFDGIDIDWEYPRMVMGNTADDVHPADTANLQNVIIGLRHKLPPNSIISIAIPHGNNDFDGGSIDNYFKGVDGNLLPTHGRFVESITTFNMMSYDFMAFAPFTTPNAPFGGKQANIMDGLGALSKLGVPPEKIFFGAPAYGRTIGSQTHGVRGLVSAPNAENDGIGIQLPPITSSSGAQSSCVISWPLYVSIDLNNINDDSVFKCVDSVNQTVSYWDEQSGISNKAEKITSDGGTQSQLKNYVDCFMSFDSPRNIAKKCEYIMKNGYAGMFFWEVNQDKRWDSPSVKIGDGTYPASLMRTAVENLNPKTTAGKAKK